MLDTATTSSITNSMNVLALHIVADRMDQDEHPGEPEEQIERNEAQAPLADVNAAGRLGQELTALGDDDGVDDQDRAGPDGRR